MGQGTILAASGSAGVVVVYLAVIVLEIAALWRIFEKAGAPGWAAIIPIYNTYVLLKIVGRPAWWIVLLFIPLVNIVCWIVVASDLSKSFGRSGAFTVGLVLLSFVFNPILGFGSARYIGPGAGGRSPFGGPPSGYAGGSGLPTGSAWGGTTPASGGYGYSPSGAPTGYGMPGGYGTPGAGAGPGGYGTPGAGAGPPGYGSAPAASAWDAQATPPQAAPADWYADPAAKHELRYWNGGSWTEHVSDNGVQGVDFI